MLKGSHHTEETKNRIRNNKERNRKISIALKGKHCSPRTEFKKGHKSEFIRKKHTEESKQKMSLKHKGKTISEEHRKKIISVNTGKRYSPQTEFKKGHIPFNKDKPHLPLEKNPAWNGGSSFEPYGIEFNEHTKEQIRQRDRYRCQQCFRHQDELRTKTNKKSKLDIHHIDFNKRNNDNKNLISLCKSCHAQTQFNRQQWTNYFQERVLPN